VASCQKSSNKPSAPIKVEIVLEPLSDYDFRKKGSAPWLVGWLVGWSVGRSVGRLVGWSVGRSVGRSVG
jgi:hypothetical protein